MCFTALLMEAHSLATKLTGKSAGGQSKNSNSKWKALIVLSLMMVDTLQIET